MTEDTYRKQRRETAEKSLVSALLWGVCLAALGGVVLSLGYPRLDEFGEERVSPWVVVIGGFIGWTGTALVLLAMVGFGVRLGNEATRER